MITADWPNYIFHIPRADLTLIQSTPVEIRECNINWLRLQIMGLEDDPAGMTFPTVFTHYPEVDVGGLTLAKSIVLNNPYTLTFEDGQYAVNLVGANSNFGDRVNVNQVSVRSANSAGMTSSPDIEYSSFNGGVTYDEINGVAGTLFPTGTPRQPVNNLVDAGLIASYRGFNTGYIKGDATFTSEAHIAHFTIVGDGKDRSAIVIEDAANVTDCTYVDAHISGFLDGNSRLVDCLIDNLVYIKGYIEGCVLSAGTIQLGGAGIAHFLDCYSGVPGSGTAIIDMSGSGQGLAMRNYNGGILLTNKTGSDKVSIDLNSGQVKLDLDGNFGIAGVTNGQIVVRGVGKCIDATSGEHLPSGTYGSLELINESVSTPMIANDVWEYTA